jgi:ygbB family
MRIGIGYDVHRLEENRKLILGGVEIPHHLGLLGHSDADVLLHAVTDALLGALALGDIGKHFPDTDTRYKDQDSRLFLRLAYALVKKEGYKLGNLDCVVMAQQPKLAPHIDLMRTYLAEDLQSDLAQISIKATTTEKLGFVGKEEGIAAQAICLLERV